MWLVFPLLLALGFFLPGYLIAKSLRSPLAGPSGFLISLLVLFHCLFWLGVAGAPIALSTVLPCLILVCLAGAWLVQKRPALLETAASPRADTVDRVLVASNVLVGAVLLARSAISPLIGYDTRFRWDFLAQRLLALRTFDFYPPLSPADFHHYFYVDGIAPLVSFAHWWLYVSAGRHWPPLICLFVAAQFACTLVFTYGAARALFSRRAGFLAAAVLAASPLFFRSVVLGQETGLTALSVAAVIFFISSVRRPDDIRGMILAGLAAGLGALSREYGWVALPLGLIVILWRRQPPRAMFLFAAVAAATAAPWYARNWVLAGNPFYSLQLGNFAVNPIHAGILQRYYAQLGVHNWDSSTWIAILWLLFLWAPFQLLAGFVGGGVFFRRHGYLMIMVLILASVWIQAAGYTSSGIVISMRVLSPALVVLSISAAGLLERFIRGGGLRAGVTVALVLCHVWTAAHGVFYPVNPMDVPPAQWSRYALRPVPPDIEFALRDDLIRVLPPRARVLSDNAYLHAALLEREIEVVPVWSPEVRFLFSPFITLQDMDQRLQRLGIGAVAYYPRSPNTEYLRRASPFYASALERWRVIGQESSGFLVILVPSPG